MNDALTDDEVRAEIATVPQWYQKIELRPGIITPGINHSSFVLGHLRLPADCSGLRARDLGARDGYFSFELERRGAEVMAVDYTPPEATGFRVAARRPPRPRARLAHPLDLCHTPPPTAA